MAKKLVRDKAILYDANRIEFLNSAMKKSPLFAQYIWTFDLHSIDKVGKPLARPEFQTIEKELDKYREKNSKGNELHHKPNLAFNASSIVSQDKPSTTPIVEERNSKKKTMKSNDSGLGSISALDLLRKNDPETRNSQEIEIKKFETKYKDLFFDNNILSEDTIQKNQKFVNSVMNIHREIHPQTGNMQINVPENAVPNKKPSQPKLPSLRKNAAETKSAALLRRQKKQHDSGKRPQNALPFSVLLNP